MSSVDFSYSLRVAPEHMSSIFGTRVFQKWNSGKNQGNFSIFLSSIILYLWAVRQTRNSQRKCICFHCFRMWILRLICHEFTHKKFLSWRHPFCDVTFVVGNFKQTRRLSKTCWCTATARRENQSYIIELCMHNDVFALILDISHRSLPQTAVPVACIPFVLSFFRAHEIWKTYHKVNFVRAKCSFTHSSICNITKVPSGLSSFCWLFLDFPSYTSKLTGNICRKPNHKACDQSDYVVFFMNNLTLWWLNYPTICSSPLRNFHL